MPAQSRGKAGKPSGVDLMWGLQARPSRGPRPGLSLDAIVEAGIAIADADGLGALSMQRIAAELGYTTMSLYRYVPGKDQLIEVMSDVVHGEPPAPRQAPWRELFEEWVRGIWTVYRNHPWLLKVPVDGAPSGPQGLQWFDAALRSLSGAGLAQHEMISVPMFVGAAVRGLAQLTVDLTPNEQYGEVLAMAMQTGRYPHLAELVTGGMFEAVGTQPPESEILPDLEFGLQRILDGVDAYVEAHGRGTHEAAAMRPDGDVDRSG